MNRGANTASRQARWKYGGVRLELEARLIHRRRTYVVPAYAGEGWGHSLLKLAIAVHLLEWGYTWEGIRWEYSPSNVRGHRRADLFAPGQGGLPSFWFECGGTDNRKLRYILRQLPDTRIVHVMPHDWFLRWWNAHNVMRVRRAAPRDRRRLVRAYRARTAVVGVEYWAVYDTSTSARILFAVRPEGSDRYTYFDTGEGWSLSHILMLSRRTDCWAALIPRVAGGDRRSRYDAYLSRRKGADSYLHKTRTETG